MSQLTADSRTTGTKAAASNHASLAEPRANTNTEQSSANYKEAFSLFDKRGNGRVVSESLGDLLRACGQNPTLAEIKELQSGIGGDCKLFVTDCQCLQRFEYLLMLALHQSTMVISSRS